MALTGILVFFGIVALISLVSFLIMKRDEKEEKKEEERDFSEDFSIIEKKIIDEFKSKENAIDFIDKNINYDKLGKFIKVSPDIEVFMMNSFNDIATDMYKKCSNGTGLSEIEMSYYISQESTSNQALYEKYVDVYYAELDRAMDEALAEEEAALKELEKYGNEPAGDPELHNMNRVMFESSKMGENDGKIIGEYPSENAEYKSIEELEKSNTIENL